ncbi:MAG: hypothetical protein HC897_05125 [Thermoanaerobaculia bacterium]|nr:hypothetical protein [Thermoanaerobaculia bacterium]
MNPRGLKFPFKSMIDECALMRSYAKDVLDSETTDILDELKGQLTGLQNFKTGRGTTRWELPPERALRTIWSEGKSQPDGKSGWKLRAKFSFAWDIHPVKKAAGRPEFFSLDGLASTVVQIEDDEERCLLCWATEVGDHQSPGAHFHFQLKNLGLGTSAPSLDIPRLPALLMSPFLAMELAIGELFQDEWRRYALSEKPEVNQWRKIHQPRLESFFKWQMNCLRSAGSPWIALKAAKPHPDLLISKNAP